MTPTNYPSKAVWKYTMEPGPISKIQMPLDATILTVQLHDQIPHIWVEVNPDAPLTERTFHTICTGSQFPSHLKYLGTFQMIGGKFVFHLYEDLTNED